MGTRAFTAIIHRGHEHDDDDTHRELIRDSQTVHIQIIQRGHELTGGLMNHSDIRRVIYYGLQLICMIHNTHSMIKDDNEGTCT